MSLFTMKNMDDMRLKIRIRDINPHIVCSLCAGYYVEATTIMECLHTFCKSCIVKYLQTSKFCPQCNTKIHETQPLMNLKPDRVMQDIVYKLVPGLYEDEERKKQEFYKSKGLVKERRRDDENIPPSLTSVYDNPRAHYYRHDEQVCMCLEKYSHEPVHGYTVPSLPKKFVRCSIRTCIYHIKHLLRKKLIIPSQFRIELVCEERVLSKEMTLKQIWLSVWFGKPSPLMMYYRLIPRIPMQGRNC